MSHGRSTSTITPISRRTALRAGAAAGAAGVSITAGAAGPTRAAQDATPAGMRREHLEVEWTPVDPVTITRAGGGPPQRGDHFYVDGAIYAAGDVNGTRIGTYQCFGAWTAAADDVDTPTQRLTTVQYKFDDESAIMGLINEAGTADSIGAVMGGTGRFMGATGTFQQITVQPPGDDPSPGAPGTPGPGQFVLRTTFDLILPQGS
ncbi:MAG: hypothetical protein ACRDJC_09360 [Thermomicrobiales bacterium]